MERIVYKAFGFAISSDYDLPELPRINIEGSSDIIIMEADLSWLWSKEAKTNEYFVVKEAFVMFQVPDVAIYLVKNGNEIFVSPAHGAQQDQVRHFILGTCMGVALMQRRILPLHGSAVVVNGKAYAIIGDSGLGKSTLALAFLEKGYQLLSDDVIAIALSAEDIPFVTPAYPEQKLPLDSLNEFGKDMKDLKPIIDRKPKFAVPVLDQFATKPVALAGVIELVTTVDEKIEVTPILNVDGLHTLYHHTYRNFLIERLGIMEWHFNMTAKVMNHINFHQICRPISRFTANELVDSILEKLSTKEQLT